MAQRVSSLRGWMVVSALAGLALGLAAVPRAAALAPAEPPVPIVEPAAELVESDARAILWPTFVSSGVEPSVLELAMNAAGCAARAGLVAKPATLTVIDFSRPSTERRLWVFDLETGHPLFHELVAHGQGSGDDLATVFSNEPDSHRSSLGLFLTAEPYVGKHGYSLRLDGLEAGFNDRARERAIVVHGADYVSDAFVQQQGRLGRSWGCPALGTAVASDVIDRIKEGNLVFAYYPDRAWLNGSPLLGDCSAAGRPGTAG